MTERLQALPSQTSAPAELPWCPTSYSPCLLLRRHRRPCRLPLVRFPNCEPADFPHQHAPRRHTSSSHRVNAHSSLVLQMVPLLTTSRLGTFSAVLRD